MKKIFFLFSLFCTIVGHSQDVLAVIGRETCECLDTKKLDFKKLSKMELQTQIGLCMIQSYSTHSAEFKPEDKVSLENTDGMRKLGEKVAVKMLTVCPETIIEMGRNSIAQEDIQEVIEEEDAFIVGEVTEIKAEQFITLYVKDKNGRNYNFLLLDYFQTAALITNNELKKKDAVKVSYTELELYDTKNKEFRYYKIITDLEKQ